MVNSKHHLYQRILWRSDPNSEVKTYILTTVTYGTGSASHTATRVTIQLTNDEQSSFPIASNILKSDTYVDDIITGGNTIEEVLTIQKQLIALLERGGFSLHKWCSNSDLLLENIPSELRETIFRTDTSSNESIKTLGLAWKPQSDQFIFEMQPLTERKVITKRIVMSDISKLYDPLGLLAPVIITAKLFIQDLWKSQLDWDCPIPPDVQQNYLAFRTSLMNINSITFDRYVLSKNYIQLELHGYADASEKAYGACVYVRSKGPDNSYTVNLLCSKTRVAPLKTLTVPRLELCAALLLARLIKVVTEALKIQIKSVTLWSVSSIALSWIKTDTHKLETFQANRVNEIQLLTSDYVWKHISSEINPADILSRGMTPSDLMKTPLWWEGPPFLKLNESFWPTEKFIVKQNECVTLGIKKDKIIFLNTELSNSNFNLIHKYSSFNKLIHTTAYCLRFINYCRGKAIRKRSHLLVCDEIENALQTIIRIIQIQEFPTEYKALKSNSEILHSSKIKSLNPFMDEHKLLRVGERLKNSSLEYDAKHQYLLPSHHYFTKLLFQHEHKKHYHAGPQLLVSLIRQRFWPTKAKVLAKSVVHGCVSCCKFKPKIASQIMGNLSRERINTTRPFATTGVDFCGPFLTKNKYQRNSSHYKIYAALFVCFATKAIHIELVSDQTSASFIACLKRFISRRGKPTFLWSDNSQTFVGARNELKKIFDLFKNVENISQFCIMNRFHGNLFHHGSQILVDSGNRLSNHSKRITSARVLSYEELNNIVINIEGILNSRPLWPMSDDPRDSEPLTAEHFFTGGPIPAINEPSLTSIPSNHLSKWRLVTQLVQSFWKRFSVEYLHHLQQRVKWKSIKENVKVTLYCSLMKT